MGKSKVNDVHKRDLKGGNTIKDNSCGDQLAIERSLLEVCDGQDEWTKELWKAFWRKAAKKESNKRGKAKCCIKGRDKKKGRWSL